MDNRASINRMSGQKRQHIDTNKPKFAHLTPSWVNGHQHSIKVIETFRRRRRWWWWSNEERIMASDQPRPRQESWDHGWSFNHSCSDYFIDVDRESSCDGGQYAQPKRPLIHMTWLSNMDGQPIPVCTWILKPLQLEWSWLDFLIPPSVEMNNLKKFLVINMKKWWWSCNTTNVSFKILSQQDN